MNDPSLNDISKKLEIKSPSEKGREWGKKYEQAITQGLKRGEKNDNRNAR